MKSDKSLNPESFCSKEIHDKGPTLKWFDIVR